MANAGVYMSPEAFRVLENLTKNTLIDLVWSAVRFGLPPSQRDDEHAVLHAIDVWLQPVDVARKQRPKLLASKYAEQRVAAAQGGAVVTKQVRTRITPRRSIKKGA